MGNALSTVQNLYILLLRLNTTFNVLLKRISTSPGLPVPNPTISYWQTPEHPNATTKSSTLPTDADIVILGSGITGCSIAKHLLDGYTKAGIKPSEAPRVVLLEARTLCSGATGRNGGHIKETPFADWRHLKKLHGVKRAKEIVRFRGDHLDALLAMAKEEGIAEECGIQWVTTGDYFFDEPAFSEARRRLEEYQADLSEEERKRDMGIRGWKVWETEEARKEFHLDSLIGAITYSAGSLSPYRMVCAIFTKLLSKYPNFSIETETPCTEIKDRVDSNLDVITPRGTITTGSIIHATNAHISHLLPGLRQKLFPVRGTMTAQVLSPQPEFIDPTSQSISFVWRRGFDYLTFRKSPEGETIWMLGGGLVQAEDEGIAEFGIWDDSTTNLNVRAYDQGILPAIYGGKAEALRTWSGIMCWSADLLPWVGQVRKEVTGREKGSEWVAAGYSGEGMVNAWGCGKGLAQMYLDAEAVAVPTSEEDNNLQLPSGMLYTAKRLKTADIRKLTELF